MFYDLYTPEGEVLTGTPWPDYPPAPAAAGQFFQPERPVGVHRPGGERSARRL